MECFYESRTKQQSSSSLIEAALPLGAVMESRSQHGLQPISQPCTQEGAKGHQAAFLAAAPAAVHAQSWLHPALPAQLCCTQRPWGAGTPCDGHSVTRHFVVPTLATAKRYVEGGKKKKKSAPYIHNLGLLWADSLGITRKGPRRVSTPKSCSAPHNVHTKYTTSHPQPSINKPT